MFIDSLRFLRLICLILLEFYEVIASIILWKFVSLYKRGQGTKYSFPSGDDHPR